MLRHIAKQITKRVRDKDIVCRWGGDEFLIALHCVEKEKLHQIAANLLAAINTEMLWQTNETKNIHLSVGASIGVASYPKDAKELGQLIEYADKAMYAVKRGKKNAFAVYSIDDENNTNLT